MIKLQRRDDLATKFFERVWEHLVNRNSGKPGIEALFPIAKGKSGEAAKVELKEQLEKIIKATPEELEVYNDTPPAFAADWKLIKLYDQFVGKGLNNQYRPIELIKDLGHTVCPYCNRQFITSGDTDRHAELDHFYPKSAKQEEIDNGTKNPSPYLAMSFYNLIPACHSCNSIKNNFFIEKSPYMIEDVDTYITFGYTPINGDFLNDQNQIDVTMTEEITGESSYNERLKLEEHYKYHNDYVYDLIKKKEAYDETYLKELLKLGQNENDEIDTTSIEGLFNSKEELRRALWGNYTTKDELHKRPLAKLTRDILREIAPEALED